MKKLFAILAVMGVLTLGSVQPVMAQDAAPAQTEQTTEAAVVEEGGGLHKELKTKFIEGDASFMSLVAIALVLGLAFCIERIIYLSLAETNTKKLMANIEAALEKGDVEAAKTVCRNTRGPVASICYQGLMRIDEGIDVVERSVVSYGGVQAGYLEKGCSWITLFIAMAPEIERYTETFCHMLKVGMVTYNQRNFHIPFSGRVACQHIEQAMGQFGNKYGHFGFYIREIKTEFHFIFLGIQCFKIIFYFIFRNKEILYFPFYTHEKYIFYMVHILV